MFTKNDLYAFLKDDDNYIFIKDLKEVYFFLEQEFRIFKIDSKLFYDLYIRSIKEEQKLFNVLKNENVEEIDLSSFVCVLN